MTLNNIINIANEIKSKEVEEQKYFDVKLAELREFQNKTELRLNQFRKDLFPEDIYKLISNFKILSYK